MQVELLNPPSSLAQLEEQTQESHWEPPTFSTRIHDAKITKEGMHIRK